MSDLLTEDLPYKETANGSLNPNSYASMAVFGLASWAYEEIHNAGLKLTKDNLDALLLTFAQIVDEAQQKITGVTSFQDGTNTRLRGLLHTYVETHPIPFGKSEDEWDVWVATGKKHLSSIAAAALRGYRADLGGKPWQALAIREAGDDFDESAS